MACALRGGLRFRAVKYCALILVACLITFYHLTPSARVCDVEPGSHSIRNVSDTVNTPTWQAVIPRKLHVYSAFYTLPAHCTSGTLFSTIKITALLNRKDTVVDTAVRCWCLYGDTTINAEIQEYWDHHNKVYAAGTITCETPKIEYLSHVDLQCQIFNQIGTSCLSIMPPPRSPRPLTMCGPIVYGSDTIRAEHVIEFVEYYKMTGVSKFFFYFYDTGFTAELLAVLKHYKEIGLVDILEWNLPREVEKKMWYNAQLVALNDCMMRTAGHSWDYAVAADVDEFIISSGGTTLQNIVHNGSCDCVQIRHAAVRETYHISSLLMRLQSHMNRTRDPLIFWKNWRSKYICRPKSLLSAGIHNYDAMRPGTRILTADAAETVLLHLRDDLVEENAPLMDINMEQLFGLERWKQLTNKVTSVYRDIFGR